MRHGKVVRPCPSWVKSAVSTVGMSLPVFPNDRTSSVSVDMSQTCQKLSHSNSDDLTTCALCACDHTGLRSNSFRSAA